MTVGYYANDLVASQTQGTNTATFTLDPTQNRFIDTTTGLTTTAHYAGGTDSPAWSSTSATNWTWNIIGIDGALAGTKNQAGTLTWNLTNLHGDVTGTTDNTGLPTAAGYESTEYGAARDATTTPDTYGWLGAKQRSTNNLAGLTLMGVRLYNPQSGRFLSVDSVPGGNADAYTYPLGPLNQLGLSGLCLEDLCIGEGAFVYWAVCALFAAYATSQTANNYCSHHDCSITFHRPNLGTFGSKSYGYGDPFGQRQSIWETRADKGRRKKGSGGKEHDKGARPSTTEAHEKGQTRKGKDLPGGEKCDKHRKY